MAWTLTGDLGEYLDAAGDFLRADPVQCTIELAAVEQMLARGTAAVASPGPLFGWWRPGAGPVTAAALHTPPYPLLLTPLPAGAAPPLARSLRALGRTLSGVNGQQADSARFAAGRGRAVHRPGQRGEQRTVPPAGLPAGGRPHHAQLHVLTGRPSGE
jgi:hypothetical protein